MSRYGDDVAALATPLTDAGDLDVLLDRVGDASVVLIGEASHGTYEFYRWRALLSWRLIVEKGFRSWRNHAIARTHYTLCLLCATTLSATNSWRRPIRIKRPKPGNADVMFPVLRRRHMFTRHSKRVRSAVVVGVMAASAMLAACGDDDTDTSAPTTAPVTMPSTTATTGTDEDKVTPEAARQLCDMIAPEIDNWRDQGTVLGKVSFNGTVQNWAARNQGLNDEVIRDKSIIDDVTTETCPDVRDQATKVLEVPDLASALAGFGG